MPNTVQASAPALPSRRAALLASLAGLDTVAGLPALADFTTSPSRWEVPADTDLTFVLIERHRTAYRAWDAALRTSDGDEADAEGDAERHALEALLSREPTTMPGLRAFADYTEAHLTHCQDHEAQGWALATLAEACRLLIPAHADGGGL